MSRPRHALRQPHAVLLAGRRVVTAEDTKGAARLATFVTALGLAALFAFVVLPMPSEHTTAPAPAGCRTAALSVDEATVGSGGFDALLDLGYRGDPTDGAERLVVLVVDPGCATGGAR